MQKDSLEIAINLMIDTITASKIKSEDKIELLINLRHFLDPKEYSNNIDVLIRTKTPKRY